MPTAETFAARAEKIRHALGFDPKNSGTRRLCDMIVEELSAATMVERKRCNAIVQAARAGEIDQDFRSISARIINPDDTDDE